MPIQNSSPRELLTTSYNREQAVRYANYWAYRRNPNYSSFDSLGGDCTNFVSQALFYAAGVMNFTPDYGWYYISLDNRAPAWSGVEYFWNFMTTNMGPGPFGHEISLSEVLPGDIIQMAIKEPERFGHTVIVTDLLSQSPGPDSILVAAHDRDSACRGALPLGRHRLPHLPFRLPGRRARRRAGGHRRTFRLHRPAGRRVKRLRHHCSLEETASIGAGVKGIKKRAQNEKFYSIFFKKSREWKGQSPFPGAHLPYFRS